MLQEEQNTVQCKHWGLGIKPAARQGKQCVVHTAPVLCSIVGLDAQRWLTFFFEPLQSLNWSENSSWNEWNSCSTIHRRSNPLWIYFDFVFPFDLLKPMSLHVILVFLKHKNANKNTNQEGFHGLFCQKWIWSKFFPSKKVDIKKIGPISFKRNGFRYPFFW